MSESSSPTPRALWGRLALSAGALLLIAFMPAVGLPGIDTSAFDSLGRRGTFDVFTMGVMPFASAAILVELGALLRPSWRALRHSGSEGRAKLGRMTLYVTVVVCVFQAFGILKLIETLATQEALGTVSAPMVIISLTAGSFLVGLVAHYAGVYGLVGGFALMVSAQPVVSAGQRLWRRLLSGEATPSPRDAAMTVLLLSAVAGATWFVLRPAPAEAKTTRPGDAYRSSSAERPRTPMTAPAPASGVTPLATALGVIAIPTLFGGEGARDALAGPVWGGVVLLGLSLVLALFYASIWNLPRRRAALAARAGDERSRDAIEDDAVRAGRSARLGSVAFVFALIAIGSVEPSLVSIELAFAATVMTALALDVAAEWRARRAAPDLVPVWPEHRPYAVAFAREALAREGVTLFARHERLRRLLQFFAPYAPIDLMVPRPDEAKAKEILAALLPAQAEDDAPRGERSAAPRAPWARGERASTAAIAVFAAATLLIPMARTAQSKAERAVATPAALEVLLVDDEADPFEPDAVDLPARTSIQQENVPLGPGRAELRRYARLVYEGNEPRRAAAGRLAAWAAAQKIPVGDRVAIGDVAEYDDERGRLEVVGARTYLLKGEPIVSGAHVAEASAIGQDHGPAGHLQWVVVVGLGAEGARRFHEATAANVRRRVAIVIDGKVESAPVVQTAISGGRVTITMGGADPGAQKEQAETLAARLTGKRR